MFALTKEQAKPEYNFKQIVQFIRLQINNAISRYKIRRCRRRRSCVCRQTTPKFRFHANLMSIQFRIEILGTFSSLCRIEKKKKNSTRLNSI